MNGAFSLEDTIEAMISVATIIRILKLFSPDIATNLKTTVKLVMFACSKYCVFFIFSFMRVLINANATRRQISETEGTDLCVF